MAAHQPDSPAALQCFCLERCYTLEILDRPGVPDHEVARGYRDLARMHRWLGNTGVLLNRLRLDPIPVRSVLDIGCGHGALLEEIRARLGVAVTGVDLRPPADAAVPIARLDAVRDPLPPSDVALAVCVAHHLSDNDFCHLIRNVARSCRRFIVLDLVRHRVPIALFRAFVAPWVHRINVDDGVQSIRRSWTPAEMNRLVTRALEPTGGTFHHSVAPLNIRQIVDISW